MDAAAPNETRTRIIRAALLCFAEHGYDGCGLREIAARAAANSSLVAYYFGGKAGLYRESLCYIFEGRVQELIRRLPAGSAFGIREAVHGLREYIRVSAEMLMSFRHSDPVEEAAMALMAREMEAPTPGFGPQLLVFMRPAMAYLEGCLEAVRPDLDGEARFAMIISIQGQMVHLRNALGGIRLYRGDPFYPEDLPGLIEHFIGFSLRGLGLSEELIRA